MRGGAVHVDLSRKARERCRASSDERPSTSRSVITARWFAGSPSIADSTTRARLPRQQPLLRQPRAAAPLPVPVPGEAIGVDCGAVLVPVADKRRERHVPPLSDAARLRLVRQDPEQPGLQRRAALEALEAGDDGEPRVRDDLLRGRLGRYVQTRDPEQRRTYFSTSAMKAASSPVRSRARSSASSSGGSAVAVGRR